MGLRSFTDFYKDLPERFVIYGAGDVGQRFLSKLPHDILPAYIVDKNASNINSINGIKVITIEQLTDMAETFDLALCVSVYQDYYNGLLIDLWEKYASIYGRNYFIDDTAYKYIHYVKNNDIYSISEYDDGKRWILGKFSLLFKLDDYEKTQLSKDALINNSDIWNFVAKMMDEYPDSTVCFNGIYEQKGSLINHPDDGRPVVYIFGASQVDGYWSEDDYTICSQLQNILLSKHHNDVQIEKYSFSGADSAMLVHQIRHVPLKADSIVILPLALYSFVYPFTCEPYDFNNSDYIAAAQCLAEIQRICLMKNCRFIAYLLPNIIEKQKLTDYEKLHLNELTETYGGDKGGQDSFGFYIKLFVNGGLNAYNKAVQQLFIACATQGISLFTRPEEFIYSEKNLFWDFHHYGDYGHKIIAEHLSDILQGCLKPYDMENLRLKVRNIEIATLSKTLSASAKGIDDYADLLSEHYKSGQNGAIVMNCNPITNGHMYLIETASKYCDNLYIFVVREDKSFFPYDDRFRLVRECTHTMSNVTVISGGEFIISSLTFPEYFTKEETNHGEKINVLLDLLIFTAKIAPALNIVKRFAGEEPFDMVTLEYNNEMRRVLPAYGVEFIEIPRKEQDHTPISASRVRKLLKNKDFEAISRIVPMATLKYLRQNYI